MLVEEKVKAIVEGKINELGYDLYQVTYRSGKNATLTIVVDRLEPISLEDIVFVSETISKLLDEDDPTSEPYTLDVSCLGAEKPIAIEKIGDYVGRYVNLHLKTPYKGENYVEGTLLGIEQEEVRLQIRQKARKVMIAFPYGDVDKARLAIEF